ncbi:two-component regulator propeller domain-containing protein [Croceivirga sp. JEA036]|uniref:two-component regulator propeller domain-containing protein n=1 Tax=Croceivirga sp. JEA036 TaxID=2721162 RepID=UPI0014389212|nr:two-component regulator propeller domain-containing protein [Croceivirga sp. JEA036]NJB36505.1 helix-turn-helix domain-containing protein [Croceivirga sp. JEA036]
MSHFLVAQNIKFKSYTTQDGLSNNSVTAIASDEDGGLWLGTYDGLNYFDGYTFTVYKHDGANEKSLSGNHIFTIERDKQGRIWILDNRGQLCRYLGGGNFKRYSFNEPVKSIRLSNTGDLLLYLDNKELAFINNEFEPTKAIALKEDFSYYKTLVLKQQPDAQINQCVKDKKGTVWIATRRHGLFVVANTLSETKPTKLDQYTYDQYSNYSLRSNEVEKLHLDNFGNVWLAQKDGGLSMAYRGSESIYSVVPHPTKYKHLPNETVRAITTDTKGTQWLGYYSKGLFFKQLTDKCYLPFTIVQALDDPDWYRIRSMFTDSKGTVWVGTYAGIIKISGQGYSLITAKNQPLLPSNRHYGFFENGFQELWIACWGGAAKYNLETGQFEAFKGADKLKNYHIRQIKIVNSLLVLATEHNGILFLDVNTGKLEVLNEANGLLGNSTYSVYYDTHQQLFWFGSLGGVTVYSREKGVVHRLTEANGLPSHMVYGILDTEDYVWVSSTKGLARIQKDNYHVLPIAAEEGWQTSEFSEGAFYKDPKGIMYFGGIKGVNYFDPIAYDHQQNQQKVKYTINQQSHVPDTLSLKHNSASLELTFTPIVFPLSDKQSYYYKIEGVDQEWQHGNGISSKTYKNLPAGTYSILLKNTKIDEPVKLTTVAVGKAFYQRVWFYLGICLCVIAIAILLVFNKNKKAKVQKELLELKIAERTAVIQTQKKSLEQANTELDVQRQEIFNQKEELLQLHNSLKHTDFEVDKFKHFVISSLQEPLQKVLNVSQQLQEFPELKETLQQEAGKLLNFVIEWDYLQDVKHLGPLQENVVESRVLLEDVFSKVKQKALLAALNYESELKLKDNLAVIDALRLRLALQYVLNDILKYTAQHTTLKVKIEEQENQLDFLVISDSELLNATWPDIEKYGNYYRAFLVLWKEMEGTVTVDLSSNFLLKLQLPVKKVSPKHSFSEAISYKHLQQKDDIVNTDKPTVLILTGKDKEAAVLPMLQQPKAYTILVEHKVSDVLSAIQVLKVDLLVLYQVSFNKELTGLLLDNKERISNNRIPLVYISEAIDHTLNEKALFYNLDAVIQLPAKQEFITKKLSKLIQQRNKAESNNFQKSLFKLLAGDQEIESADDRLLRQALDIIKQHLGQPSFNVEALIKTMGISRVKCYRLFKERLQNSPSEVITSLRMQKAVLLLKQGKLNVSEISFECGYADAKYFGRSFKKQFGTTPKRFVVQEQTLDC